MNDILKYLRELIAIDSPTGFFHKTDEYIISELKKLGFSPKTQVKGGVVAELGGSGNALCIAAHADTIGLMVRRINPNGTVVVTNLGGLHPFYCLDANVRVYSRGGKVYTGVMRRANPSVHLMSEEERGAELDFEKNLFLVLDEVTSSKKETEALGICCGDCVAVEPNYIETPSGFIKSRFLDDKASCAVLLALAKKVSEGRVKLNRRVCLMFTEYEEIGHGGAKIPEDIYDFLAVDIGCVGVNHYSDERKVTIGVKDAAFPYHTDLVNEMVDKAKAKGIDYVLDMMLPRYGSDANVALRAGYDVRHGLIGPGVLETHGYERTHKDALKATYELIESLV
ncbi:MAG: M42 family metallopeptidase [Clostridia bacterium]|nr:M42 family metallopeptidase [Clostridia bacterium]